MTGSEGRKGRFTIVDLLLLLLIVAVVAGIGWKLAGSHIQNSIAPEKDMVVEAVVIGAYPRIYNEALRQDLVGEHLVAGNAYLSATITDLWLEDFEVSVLTDDGRLVNAVDPVRKNICVRIESKVAADTPVPKIGSQEVRAGKENYTLKTQRLECLATIRYVEIGGEAQ